MSEKEKDAVEEARQALRESAVVKLMTGQSSTEEDARLMVGAAPSFVPNPHGTS